MHKFRETRPALFDEVPIIFNLDEMGIGTTVSALPAIMYIKNNYNNDLFFKCHRHHMPILKHFFDENCLYPYYDSNAEKLETDSIFNLGESIEYSLSVTIHPPHQMHPVPHFFNVIAGIQPTIEQQNYLRFPVEQVDISNIKLPEKFVVIGPGITKAICQLPAHVINDIIHYCKNKGYAVVLLGGKYFFELPSGVKKMSIGPGFSEELDYDSCFNLIYKTTLDQAIAILDKAHCYIGPEGGLMNFCGMTDTPMVIGINGWEPKVRMPYRHNELGWECYPVIPSEDLKCRFCIQNTIHVRTINILSECLYEDFKCVTDTTFDQFKIQIDKVL